jgi:hypothetical protein
MSTSVKPAHQQIRRGMAETNDLFITEVFSRRNFDALNQIYTADARILPPGTPMISGGGEIKQFWSNLIQSDALRVHNRRSVLSERESAFTESLHVGIWAQHPVLAANDEETSSLRERGNCLKRYSDNAEYSRYHRVSGFERNNLRNYLRGNTAYGQRPGAKTKKPSMRSDTSREGF